MNNICFIQDHSQIGFEQFSRDLAVMRRLIQEQPYQKVLLFDNDSYRFTLGLFALILEIGRAHV